VLRTYASQLRGYETCDLSLEDLEEAVRAGFAASMLEWRWHSHRHSLCRGNTESHLARHLYCLTQSLNTSA
jgi:hypothetical protein